MGPIGCPEMSVNTRRNIPEDRRSPISDFQAQSLLAQFGSEARCDVSLGDGQKGMREPPVSPRGEAPDLSSLPLRTAYSLALLRGRVQKFPA